MANPDSPLGLRLLEGQDLQIREYPILADKTAIFPGDPVKLITDGSVAPNGSASDDFIGVAMDTYNSSGVEISYNPASTAGKVTVATNPLVRYQIQTSGTIASAGVGDCADFVATAGSTVYGQSRYELSATLAGDGASKQMRILDKVDSPDNAWGLNVNLVVVAAEHALISTPNAI